MYETRITQRIENGLEIQTLENHSLRVDIIPAMGGKIASIFNKKCDKEFLWQNSTLDLRVNEPGNSYDHNFWGGVDELLPNDIPEEIDGKTYPDHGELWTSRLEYAIAENAMSVYGLLPISGLFYQKTVSLEAISSKIKLEYNIINQSGERRRFLWKFHAALRIAKGDRLITGSRKARIVNIEASRFTETDEFLWPKIEGTDASLVPEKNGTMDFFYLYDSPVGEMTLLTEREKYRFSYHYDRKVFPYQWYFASYGQFRNHYTAILEPASAMPVQVNIAADQCQCSVLQSGEEINTLVEIYAGENS